MKTKGFIAFFVCIIALATMTALIGDGGGKGSISYQLALAAPESLVSDVTAVEPDSGTNDVDTPVVISGENFAESATAFLGETELVGVTWINSTTLEAVAPWGMSTGVYDLVVENSPEESSILNNAFEVLPGLDVWTGGSIEGGSVDEIVINPQDPNTLYASSFGLGLFRSRDAGENWQFVLSDGIASNVAIDPVEPNHLYLFGPWDLFHSADEGDRWNRLITDFPQHPTPPQDIPGFSCGADIKPFPHPTDSGTVFATVCYSGSSSGLIKSTNHGETWEEFMTGIDDPYINALAIHPHNPDKMFVGTVYGKVFLSEDGGANWELVSKLMDHIYIMEFNPHAPFELWVGGNQLVKSTNDGYTDWEEIPSPSDESWYDQRNPAFLRLHFSPNDPGSVYMILMGIGYKTTDSGKIWDVYGKDGLSFPHVFAESPEDEPGDVAVYLGDRYFGIYKSTDLGDNWVQKNNGLTAAVPEDLSVSPADPSVVYGSMQHTPGIYRGSEYGSIWQFLEALDRNFQSIAADPFTPGRVFDSDGTKICRSDDWGESWPESECEKLTISDEFTNCPNYVEVLRPHPKIEGVLLAGLRHWCDDWHYGPGSIYYTDDGGQNWTQANTPTDMKVVEDLAFDSTDNNIAYAGTTSGFYRSEDTGKTWVKVEGGPGEVRSIAVEPAREPGQEQHIVVLDGESGAIMVSSDQGLTWEEASFPNPGDNFGQFIFAPTDPPILYAASRTGLRRSSNYGQTWSHVSGDLGYVNVIALAAVKEGDRVILYAATPGGYAARTEVGVTSVSAVGLRDDTNLVNPGVYRYTQTPSDNYYLPLFVR